MKTELIPIFNRLGITEWHNKGFKGQGIKVWNCESAGGHGACSKQMILDVAPEAEVISADFGFSMGSGGFTSPPTVHYDRDYDLKEFIQKFQPDIITASIKGTNYPAWSEYMKDALKDRWMPIFNSASNEGIGDGDTISTRFPTELSIVIGALNFPNGVFKRATYSSVGPELDFSQSVGWWDGTSASTPFMAGMMALMMSRYGTMSHYETYKLLKMLSKDLGEPGTDKYYGHGQPYMPSGKYITMTTKSNEYFVDGRPHFMDTTPVNLQGNVFVPVRVISEALNSPVTWFPKTKDITIGSDIKLTVGSIRAVIRNVEYILPFAPFIDKNNRTLVPIRFIAEALNCKVDWVQSESKVMILEETT